MKTRDESGSDSLLPQHSNIHEWKIFLIVRKSVADINSFQQRPENHKRRQNCVANLIQWKQLVFKSFHQLHNCIFILKPLR